MKIIACVLEGISKEDVESVVKSVPDAVILSWLNEQIVHLEAPEMGPLWDTGVFLSVEEDQMNFTCENK